MKEAKAQLEEQRHNTDKLTDKEKIQLNTESDDETAISTEFQLPPYIVTFADNITKCVHSIFPDASPEQLAAVAQNVSTPVLNILGDLAFYLHPAAHRCMEQVRKEHIVSPPVRYTLDFSLSAAQAILNGVRPGFYEEIYLKQAGEDLSKWNRDLPEPSELPQDGSGIPVRFVIHNQIYTGKVCFFSYLSDNGDSHVISDILTFWANELHGFVHAFRIGYWQEIDVLTGEPVIREQPAQETENVNTEEPTADTTTAAE